MNEETYDKAYFAKEIQEILDELEKSKDSSIEFNEETCDNIPIGKTKIGGLPDLPPFVDYPVREGYTSEHGTVFPPLTLPLICQINCEELSPFLSPASCVPRKGMIYIFWDGGDPDYFKEKHGVNTLRVFYWDGDTSTLVRRQADEQTELESEKMVTFSEFSETYAEDLESRVEDLLGELEDDCDEYDIDYYFTDEYDILDSLRDKCVVSNSTKLFGYRAGVVYSGEAYYNRFLQFYAHRGALWYAYIDVHFEESMTGWTELRAWVEYDAD